MERKNERVVYRGKLFTIYEWDQKLYDGSIAVFERAERIPSVTIFASYKNKIVLQKQSQPHREEVVWCVPGGFMDIPGEDPVTAAQRELLEEEGLVSNDWEFWRESGTEGNYTWKNSIFFARSCNKLKEPEDDPGEYIEHSLVTPKEFFILIDKPYFRHKDITEALRFIRDNKNLRQEFLTKLGITE